MATHSRILSWKIPWIEGPGRLQFMESQRVRHNSTHTQTHTRTHTHTHTHTHILPPKVHFLISRTCEWYGKRGFEDVISLCLEMDYLGEPEMIIEVLLRKR